VDSVDFIRIRKDLGAGPAPHSRHIPPALFVPG